MEMFKFKNSWFYLKKNKFLFIALNRTIFRFEIYIHFLENYLSNSVLIILYIIFNIYLPKSNSKSCHRREKVLELWSSHLPET